MCSSVKLVKYLQFKFQLALANKKAEVFPTRKKMLIFIIKELNFNFIRFNL